jgi:hypothetical protein
LMNDKKTIPVNTMIISNLFFISIFLSPIVTAQSFNK